MSDHLVEVRDRDVLDVHQLAADFVHRVVLVHHEGVGQRVETRQAENRIVVLHDNLQREEKRDHLGERSNDSGLMKRIEFTSPVP